jgi:hypothetical protein
MVERQGKKTKKTKKGGGAMNEEVKVEVKEREVKLFSCFQDEKWIEVYKVIIEVQGNIYRFYFSKAGIIIPESLILDER